MGHVVRMREKKGAYRILVGKAESKSSLGRSRYGWEDNIKIDVQEMGLGLDLIHAV